jgi:hypothetical protein
MRNRKFKKGTRVSYIPYKGAPPEKGIVKSVISSKEAYIVFNCNEEWEYYEDYTGSRTPLDKVVLGWPNL